MDAIAITDHGTMYGAIEFLKKERNKVKPIIGLEGYVTRSMTEKVKDNFHVTLLAKKTMKDIKLNEINFHCPHGGYYYKPRFSKEILKSIQKE